MLKFFKEVVGGSATGVKDLPYNIGEPYSSARGSWVHYRGTSKDDGTPVLVFSLSGSNNNDGNLAAGRNGVKRLRTVRHPNILSFLHSTEAEIVDGFTTKVTIYLVTEPVMPLSEKIKELRLEVNQRDQYFAWGLHQIAKAVSFLNNDSTDGLDITPIRVSSTTSLTNLTDHPLVFGTSTDGSGELESGIHEGEDGDKDGWDDIEPLEEAKPSPVLANIQAAQKRPASQGTNSRLKSTSRASEEEDGDLWGSLPDLTLKSTSKPSRVVEEDDPWGAITAPVLKSSSRSSLNLKPKADDDLWASIAAPPPTTGSKPLSSARGKGTKPAAQKLRASRINRTSSET